MDTKIDRRGITRAYRPVGLISRSLTTGVYGRLAETAKAAAKAQAQELGGLAMLKAIARKVGTMQQTAHDHTMRQEGAAAAYAALGKKLEALAAQKPGSTDIPYEQVHALLQNMQQAAIQQMTQQSGRSLQASDVLEACRALSNAEAPDAQDA